MDSAEVFIDGYNLYYGMRDAGLKPWLWVDLYALARKVTPADVRLSKVRYYTAPAKGNHDGAERQRLFWGANQAHRLDAIEIVKGFMLSETRACKSTCKGEWQGFAEKQTDVNLAVDIALAAAESDCSLIVLISGDSDQQRPVELACERGKTVIVAFPPARWSQHLKSVASKSFEITAAQLLACQLPDNVPNSRSTKGEVFSRPDWGLREGYTGPDRTGPPPEVVFPTHETRG